MSDKKVRKLENFDDLFGADNSTGKIESNERNEIELSRLVAFENHPFKLYEGKKLDDMAESIRENGIITPIIVRVKGDNIYEILSGHNRVNAAKIAGLKKVPAIVKEGLSDAEAKIIVTDTNFMQRSVADMLPSELAKSLKMQLEACKEAKQKQELIKEVENTGESSDDNGFGAGALLEHQGKSVEKVADKNKMSRANIQRYIRLNNLITNLLDMVDDEKIGLYPAVSLSYLKQDEQLMVLETMESNNFKIDMTKAETLRTVSESGSLTGEKIYSILKGEYNKMKKTDKPATIKLKPKLVSKFFSSGQKQAEIEEVIEKALTQYFERLKEMGDH
ncbi:MAG: ParB/RepB/Spo0J family partition protein [Ruminiclostridium sp.]|nr:ParB/RepB/Spo0J family partition protein [Ruminiclostridium sp.]